MTTGALFDAFILSARTKGSKGAFRRIGRHAKDGRFLWWGALMGVAMRKRKLLRGTVAANEVDDFHRWAAGKGLESQAKKVEQTRHVTGAEANVHRDLLLCIERFMAAHLPRRQADIISGFRAYAKQLALWLAFQAGTGNPANRPGSSKHEATGGFKVARACDTYISGVPFWRYVADRGLTRQAEAFGLRCPYDHEPWHVEKAGL